jgi:proteasome lid subunit RPN8/RPN11
LASDVLIQVIRVPCLLWARTIAELRRRGHGARESGAFLLGRQGGFSAKVTSFICYDDLDPDAYQSGAIEFHAAGYAALWKHCRQKGLQLLCDVHTHPGKDVRQSHIDRRHPMIAISGHTAMIVPNFANTSRWSLQAVGVYEYLGNFEWRTYDSRTSPCRVQLTLW